MHLLHIHFMHNLKFRDLGQSRQQRFSSRRRHSICSNFKMLESHLFASNLFESNLFEFNLFESNLFASNLFESNLFESNLFESNLFESICLNPILFESNLIDYVQKPTIIFKETFFLGRILNLFAVIAIEQANTTPDPMNRTSGLLASPFLMVNLV